MASKGSIFFFVAMLAATFHSSAAQRVHVVGDGSGWTFPASSSAGYTTWASKQTFTQGDILLFNFATGSHNVAEVSKAAYDACNITSPISTASQGPANITLSSAGEHYYICTFPNHCGLGMKLAINVSAARTNTPAPQPTPSSPAQTPSPASTPKTAPAPAPAPGPTRSTAPVTYVVGNAFGWSVPTGGPGFYQTWANNKTFRVGDILIFNFANGAHNVAQLTSKAAYDSCNTSAALTPITTSPARITLTTPGEHYYICTFPQHCSLGQKLAISVSGTPSSTPASPSGSPIAPSSPTPTSDTVPPPPSSAPIVAVAALPITLFSVAFALLF